MTVVDLKVHPSPHPFVRRTLVRGAPRDLPPGAVVTMRSPDGVILGDGFWNPRSEIALRRLTDGDVRFDGAALAAAIDRAATLREGLPGLAGRSDAYRVVHAEGDGLSGLVVDRFGEVLGVELHAAGWRALLPDVVAALHARLGTRFHRARMSERVARLEGVEPLDERGAGCPERLEVREGPTRYHVDLALGHKTGFFCDQRENRARFATEVAGRDVLDVCCFTGGFALAALVEGGAASATGVDLDEKAVPVAVANAKLNQVRARFVQADAFDWLRSAAAGGKRWGAVVVDPSKFIPTRRDEEAGRGKYHDLNRLALKVVEPGGLLLTCSCSGLLDAAGLVELVATAARKEGRRAQLLRVTGAGPDHPVLLDCPEGAYLKALWLRVW